MMKMQQTPVGLKWNNCAAEFAADKTLKRNLVQTLTKISLPISKDIFCNKIFVIKECARSNLRFSGGKG